MEKDIRSESDDTVSESAEEEVASEHKTVTKINGIPKNKESCRQRH